MALEAPTEEREEAVQQGGAHYAESLPHEYQPDAAYLELYRSALAASAPRIAQAVGTVAELVLAERGRDVVLVSLARAGTPVGVLLRRWAAHGATAWTSRTTRCRSSGARASTGWHCAISRRTTIPRRWCSSTAGRARAPSPASWPRRS